MNQYAYEPRASASAGKAGILLICLLAMVPCANAAQLDLSRTPYHLEVILHLGKHGQLTDIFRDRLQRELGDSLREALGELADVDVKFEHKLLDEVLANGLLRTLDTWEERSPRGTKTHFVLIDYVGDQFVIQARQHDGRTGLPSPVVRFDRTRERDFVAKAAALLVAQDFGFIGVVPVPAGPQEVRIDLQGASLGVPQGQGIKKGDVFSLVQIPFGNGAGRPVRFALLQVQDPPQERRVDNRCVCRLWQSSESPLTERPGVASYVCVKLGAEKLPVRLRVLEVQEATGKTEANPKTRVEPASGLAVQIRRHGFDGEDISRLQRYTNDFGSADTVNEKGDKGLFDRIAFVSIGEAKRFKVPVALVGDREVEIRIANASDGLEPARARRAGWEKSVSDSYQLQTKLFQEINKLATESGQRADAIARAKESLARSRLDLQRLERERDELRKELPPDQQGLVVSEERLKRMHEGATELETFLAKLEAIEKDESDPRRKEWRTKYEQGRLLETQGDLDKAMKIYKELIKQGYEPVELQKKVDELEKLWTPANPEHATARAFIFETFPGLDTQGLKDRLEEARRHFATCQKVKDVVGPKKMLNVAINHAERLKAELEKLDPINPDDEKQIEIIKDVNLQLGELSRKIDAYLRANAKEPPAAKP
jgi:tetratricopeptide (TPR) repeat protein